ncbi:MAG: apolipoprotein N-acyltransferase [Candidatus Nanopelagicales bacterium]
MTVLSSRTVWQVAWRPLLALVAGVGLVMSFPPIGLPWLAPLAIAAFVAVIVTSSLRAAIGYSVITGLTFSLVLLQWLVTLGPDAWLLLSVFLTAWFVLVGIGMWAVRALSFWPLWVGCVWVLQESLRDRVPWGGFPWGRLAFSQANAPDVAYASVGGAPLVTFVVALTGTMLCWVALTLHKLRAKPQDAAPKPPVALLPAVAALAIGIWCAGAVIPRPVAGQSAAGPAEAIVAVVQGSVPRTGLDALGQRRAVLDNHVKATIELARQVRLGIKPQPELVVWPENSSDLDPLNTPDAAQQIRIAAEAIGVPILVGAVTRDQNQPNQRWNIGLVWDPKTGPGEFYVKRHLVPFGEFIPARSLVTRVITRYERVPFDFSPGTTAGVLTVGPARLGDVICFEVADDGIVRDAVLGGGRILAVQTNNATYTFRGLGGTAQPEQQAAMATLRAVEHARTMVVAATSGITTVIAPDGTAMATAPLFEQAQLVNTVPLRDSLTIADRVGAWPEGLLAAGGLLAIVAGAVHARRRSPDRVEVPSESGKVHS